MKLPTITQDIAAATIRSDNQKTVYLLMQEYDAQTYAVIRNEADAWQLKVVHEYGENYGCDRTDSHTDTTFRPIADDILVVKDSHFVGVLMQDSGSSYNKRVTVYKDRCVSFTAKWTPQKDVLCARQGESFYSDDHERWDIWYYYLTKK